MAPGIRNIQRLFASLTAPLVSAGFLSCLGATITLFDGSFPFYPKSKASFPFDTAWAVIISVFITVLATFIIIWLGIQGKGVSEARVGVRQYHSLVLPPCSPGWCRESSPQWARTQIEVPGLHCMLSMSEISHRGKVQQCDSGWRAQTFQAPQSITEAMISLLCPEAE